MAKTEHFDPARVLDGSRAPVPPLHELAATVARLNDGYALNNRVARRRP